MGLIKSAVESVKSVVGDQYLEYFYCPVMENGVLARKGMPQKSQGNNNGRENIISNGSKIAVQENQGLLIVEDGKVIECCAEPGVYTYDKSTEPSIFYGKFGENIKGLLKTTASRVTFGAESGKDQRVYFINLMPQMGKKFGTPTPIPYDDPTGFQLNIGVFGLFQYEISNPLSFYKSMIGNIDYEYKLREEQIDQLKADIITNLTAAVQSLAYSQPATPVGALMTKGPEIASRLKLLMQDWSDNYGLCVQSITLQGATPKEDEQYKEYLQFRKNVNYGSNQAAMVGGNAVAMQQRVGGTYIDQSGATQTVPVGNSGGNTAMDMMGMAMMGNMMGNMGMGNPLNMNQQPSQVISQPIVSNTQTVTENAVLASNSQPQTSNNSWTCGCGTINNGKFCSECGSTQPVSEIKSDWTCTCGSTNSGKFCSSCGSKKPVKIICDKCGWTPEPGTSPKFCPECGDVFDDNDME